MRSFFLGLVSVLAIWPHGSTHAESPFGTIALSPESPTSNDQITVTLTPATSQIKLCPRIVSVRPGVVVIMSNGCGARDHSINRAAIGKLSAGTYQVIWGVVDNFFNTPLPMTSVTVSFAPPVVPALSAAAALLLICAIPLVAFLRLGPNYSLKQTAEG